MSPTELSRGRKFLFYVILVLTPFVLAFVIAETAIRIFRPVPYMYPRYKYSPEYAFVLYPNTRMVHGWPGKFRFHYTINALGYRGRAVEISDVYSKPNIVVLGDSYSFGIGVDDEDPYPAVLEAELRGTYNVINLATPGWGLTQHIRRYFEFGERYDPDIVVLQYCSNDPEDNLTNTVTRIESGEFEFTNRSAGVHRFKKYLSHSIIQKSQLYNTYRGRLFELLQNRYVARKAEEIGSTVEPSQDAMPRERFYCDLLEKFSHELQKNEVALVMISVEGQLGHFRNIEACITRLDADGALDYVEIGPWLEGIDNRHSPEGHWGTGSHRAIGRGLAKHILSLANRK